MRPDQLRLAVRSLLRSPGFAITATLTLALGIGFSTAVFTVADTLLIRRLPVAGQNQLVILSGETQGGHLSNFPLRRVEVQDFAQKSRALSNVAFFTFEGASPMSAREGDQLFRLRRALVSGNFFDVLVTRPALGRTLRAEDDLPGAAPVLVLSHRAWTQQFEGDSSVLERSLVLHESGQTVRIVGVMPQGLDFPRGADFWAPVIATSAAVADSIRLTTASYNILARLRPGASPASARAELTAFFARADAPEVERKVRGAARTLPDVVLGDTRPAVIALAAAAALLLLLTCINVANLLLVRGLSRVREVAVRTALGASRGQVVAQLLSESAVIAVSGAAAGAALAATAVRGFVIFAPAAMPRLDEVRVNADVLVIATSVTAVATLLFALAPAVATSRADLHDVLRSGGRQATGSRGFRIAGEALVAGQIALAVIVLSFAGLMMKSFLNLERVDLAFAPGRMVVAELALRAGAADGSKRQVALLDRLLPRIAHLPQVDAVTPVFTVPFDVAGGVFGELSTPQQSPAEVAGNPMLDLQVVTPDYFRTLGIALTHGRGFTEGDVAGAPPAVVVSASVARHYWPAADAVGQRLAMGRGTGEQFTVVGTVPDTRYRDLRSDRPSVYFPIGQSFFPVVPMTLLIRASHSPAGLVPALRRVMAEEGSGVEVARAVPFERFLEEPLAQPRLSAMLLSAFGGAAALLAGIGLFGVIAATVRTRTRELGIRMALGANSGEVRRLVTMRGLRIALTGALVGLAATLLSGRLLAALLYEVRPADPTMLALTIAVLLVVAAIATILPAQASTRIDPAIALRVDV